MTDIEIAAANLKAAIEQLKGMGAIRINTFGKDVIEVQLGSDVDFASIPGNMIVGERDDDRYPLEIIKQVQGVKFFRILSKKEARAYDETQ